MRRFTFKGGVHPYEGKELSAEKPVRIIEPGSELAFLLSQHIGAPAVPCVKKGERVLVGQKIAEAAGYVSCPVFSSVSGIVKKVDKRKNISGALSDAIIVENDRLYEPVEFTPLPGGTAYRSEEFSKAEVSAGAASGQGGVNEFFLRPRSFSGVISAIKPDEILESMKPSDVLDRIRNGGIVGMGGAGFPTHVKLSPSDPENIDYILVNGSECEPYITCDYRLLCDRPGELVCGLKAVLKLFGTVRGVFCIEDNKPNAIRIIKEACRGEENILVAVCRTKYPEGAERSLIKAVTGREVNSKMLPADAGCIVCNVSTIYAIFGAVFLGRTLYQRFLTLSGDAVANPGNFSVPIGMYFRELIERAGGFISDPEKIIAGGPMMGFSQSDLSGVVTKTTSALTCFRYDLVSRQRETACINCGRCVNVCPARLVPSHLATMAQKGQMDKFEANFGLECINCGSCSWSCPAKRPLAVLINQGRQTVLENRRKARK